MTDPRPTIEALRARVEAEERAALEAKTPPRRQRKPWVNGGGTLNQQVTERLLEGRRQASRMGWKVSGPTPYGYRRDQKQRSRLLPDPVESEVVRRIFSLYTAGWIGGGRKPSRHASLKHVIDELRAEGRRTRRGKAWSRAGLVWILRNVTYVGRVTFDGVESRGQHDPLVSPIIFHKAQKRLAAQDKGTRKKKAAP